MPRKNRAIRVDAEAATQHDATEAGHEGVANRTPAITDISHRFTPAQGAAAPGSGRASRIAGYTPRTEAKRLMYAEVKDLVGNWVLAVPFRSNTDDLGNLSAVVGLLEYARNENIPTDATRALIESVIDRYGVTLDTGSAGTVVWRLNRVAEAVHGHPLAVEGRTKFSRTRTQPYDRAERLVLEDALALLVKDKWAHVRDLQMLFDLTFRAGCSSASIATLRVRHFEGTEDGPGVLTDPDRGDVKVPLPQGVSARISTATAPYSKDAFLFRPDEQSRYAVVTRLVEWARLREPALASFQVARAQKTWRVEVLNAWGFPHMAKLVGARTGNRAITDIAEHLKYPTQYQINQLNQEITQ